jgi:trimeric autotransporter adhesin
MKNLSILFFCFFSFLINAQNPRLAWDIGKTSDSLEVNTSIPSIVLDDKVLFVGYDNVYNYELWISDGTATGTHLLKDISTGSDYSLPLFFKKMGNLVFFLAQTPETGYELWCTDGTKEGTKLVKDIFPGTTSSIDPVNNHSPEFTEFQGKLVFKASDAIGNYQLWCTDGTEIGTIPVTNKTFVNYPSDLAVLSDSILLFSGYTWSEGIELWKTDGTFDGTSLLKDILTGPNSSYPKVISVSDGYALIQANTEDTNINGTELWRTDGTETGTFKKKNFINSLVIISAGHLDGQDFVVVHDVGDKINLYKTDGSTQAPVLLKTLATNAYYVIEHSDKHRLEKNGKLYFTYEHPNEGFGTLWKTDGTAAGTQIASYLDKNAILVKTDAEQICKISNDRLESVDDLPTETPISVGFTRSRPGFTEPYFSQNGNAVYSVFRTENSNDNFNLSKINLLTGQVNYIHTFLESNQLNGNCTPLSSLGSKFFFTANEPINNNRSLYMMDAETGEQVSFTDFANNPNPLFLYSSEKFSNGKIFFKKNDNVNYFYSEIWTSDGTINGTKMLISLQYDYTYLSFFEINGKVIFNHQASSAQGDAQNGLWRSDGTINGTERFETGVILDLVKIGNKVFYIKKTKHADQDYRFEIWKTDGETTEFVKFAGFETILGPPSYPLIFEISIPINLGDHYAELKRSNANGVLTDFLPTLVEGFAPIPTASIKAAANAQNCFVAYKFDPLLPNAGLLLWKCPLGGSQFEFVASIPANDSTILEEMFAFGDKVVASTYPYDAYYAHSLWLHDGINSLASKVIVNPTGDDYLGEFKPVGDSMLVFRAFTGTNWTIWRTDGTESGTSKLADFPAGSANTNVSFPVIRNFFVVGKYLYFSGFDELHGDELWVLDLTQPASVAVPFLLKNKKSDLTISPNPTSGSFFIAYKNEKLENVKSIEIMDNQGVFVKKMDKNALNELDIKEFAAGIYVVKVVFEDGKMEVSRLVKI